MCLKYNYCNDFVSLNIFHVIFGKDPASEFVSWQNQLLSRDDVFSSPDELDGAHGQASSVHPSTILNQF